MRIFSVIVFLMSATSAFAIPGVDTAQAIKQYYVLLKQLNELKKQVTQADEMISQSKQVVHDAEGHYGFGNFLDSDSDFQKRNWVPSSWEDALKNLSGGNPKRYQELLKAYQKEHYSLSDNQYSKGASQSLVRNYKNLVEENRAAKVSSDYEYEKIKSYLDNVHQLSKKIESAPNTKAAMDLNSRLIAELSYISVEELRMQTLMNHQMAAEVSDNIEAKTREAIFNQLPEGKN